MQHYQTIKAYECTKSIATCDYNSRLIKGNVEAVQTIYNQSGEVVQVNRRVFEDIEKFNSVVNK